MILLVPFEKINNRILKYIKNKISKTFKSKVAISKSISVPKCRKRNSQLDAKDFLPVISKNTKKEKAKFGLGITEKDLYVEQLNFVFGLAFFDSAIISLFRLKGKKFFSRAAKEAIHEIGHLYGLKHCSNAKCVMCFSNCVEDVDFKEEKFCKRCKKLLNLK